MNGLNLNLHRHVSSGNIIQYIVAFITISAPEYSNAGDEQRLIYNGL